MSKYKIGEIAKVISGIPAPKTFCEDGGIPFYRAGSLEELINDNFLLYKSDGVH